MQLPDLALYVYVNVKQRISNNSCLAYNQSSLKQITTNRQRDAFTVKDIRSPDTNTELGNKMEEFEELFRKMENRLNEKRLMELRNQMNEKKLVDKNIERRLKRLELEVFSSSHIM